METELNKENQQLPELKTDANPRKKFTLGKPLGKSLFNELLQVVFLFVYSFLIMASSEWVSRASASQTGYYITHHFLEYFNESLFIFFVVLLLYAIIRYAYIAALAGGLIFTIASTVNYIKVSTRSEPLLPWDFTIIKDAGEIANRVQVHITHQLILSYAIVLVCAVGLFLLRKKFRPIKLNLVLHICIPVVIIIAGYFFTSNVFMNDYFLQKHDIKEITWSEVDNYNQNGFIFSFLNNLGHRSVVKPVNYSKTTVDNAIKTIKTPAAAPSTVKPNIIMVQDEALCDLTEFTNVHYSQDIMPELQSLKQNSITGHLLTPMYGGGTANSEFEVLTGFTYSYLPNGSVPYEEYFKSPTFSYASFLKDLGYSTIAVHSFDRTFWDRNTVFPNIGFDNFIAENNFKNPQMERGFISDLSTVKMITQQYEQNLKTGKPFFNFTITMQNHYSWGADDYPANYRVGLTTTGMTQEEKNILTTYSTGVRDADAALKYLIDYYSKVKQPTIIVFYGDHMPALDENTLTAGGYLQGDTNSPLNIQKKHSTPYVIWNNYNAAPAQTADMSMYELVPFLDQTFNLQRPLYFDYLEDQYNTYRGYATGVYLNSDDQPVMQMPAGGQNYLNDQELFEYDLLIGNKFGTALTKTAN